MIGILIVCSYFIYTLFDPGSILSYVTPFITRKLSTVPALFWKPFAVSTPIGNSIIAKRVYRGCTIEIVGCQTSADLIVLEMLDIDIIMDMDWLASCYTNADY